MASAKKPPIRIVEVTVKNYRRISFAHVILKGLAGLVRITGKNTHGKSSLEKAIRDVLVGPRGMSERALKDDESEGYAQLLLSNGFVLTRHVDAENPKGKLVIQGPDGGRWGQSDIDKWLGKRFADPLSFYEMDEEKRAAALLATSGDDNLAVELAKLRARKANLKEERTPHIVAKNAAKSVAEPEGIRPEPVDVRLELERLRDLRQRQEERDNADRSLARRIDDLNGLRHKIASLEEQLVELRRDEEVETERVLVLREEFSEVYADQTEAIEAVEAHVKDADVVREQMKPWQAYDDAQSRLLAAQQACESYDEMIDATDEAIRKMLAEATLPIPGLTFDEDGAPLIKDRPYAVWSGAEKIGCAVAVAIAAEPQLRVCLLDEANDLDMDAMAELEELAMAHDFQIWLCRIGLEGAGEVHFEDGKTVG